MRISSLTTTLAVLMTAGAVVFLGFLAGSATLYFDGPFAAILNQQFRALEQVPIPVAEKEQSWTIYTPSNIWTGVKPENPDDWHNPPAPDTEPGVYVLDETKVQPGLTLYTPVYPEQAVRLIDMRGKTLYQWPMPDISELQRDDDVTFSRTPNPAVSDMYVYPNGNLLVQLSHDMGYHPYGLGLVMLDKDSNVLWSYMKQAHHQVDVSEDGLIAAMVGKMINEKPAGLSKVVTPYMDEDIVILSPDGTELAKVSLLESIRDSEWQGLFLFTRGSDLFHLNAAKFLTAEQAAYFPNAKAGHLLLSLHAMDSLAVLDPYAGKIVWAVRGPWHRQHDPHVLDNGNILLFDNKGDLRRGSRSRIVEFNARTNEIVWSWPTDDSYDLYSAVNGAVEPLANGNVLIAETSKGRLLEVTRQGELVWQYQIPESIDFWDYRVTKVWHPRRIDPADYPFLQ